MGSASFPTECELASLTPNAWNQVELRADSTNGPWSTEVLLNGKSAGRCSVTFGDDTSASIEIGLGTPPNAQRQLRGS